MSHLYHSLAEVRQRNAAIGHHWFDADAMEFFGTRIESDLLTFADRQFFITSEQDLAPYPRLFTIREANPDGSISTYGKFQGYKSKEDAVVALYNSAVQ